ncbi:hypothetical protein Hanom_Chr06g00569301 [Helianthus anomalus]
MRSHHILSTLTQTLSHTPTSLAIPTTGAGAPAPFHRRTHPPTLRTPRNTLLLHSINLTATTVGWWRVATRNRDRERDWREKGGGYTAIPPLRRR